MDKKLLQLNVTANWGSTGKIAEGIGIAAIENGWESTIAYGREMNPSQSNLFKVGNNVDVYLHYAKNRLFDSEGLGSKNATKKLIEFVEDYTPDIIQLHNIHDHWLNYPILFEYFRTIDTPIVWTFHDCWAFTGGCAYFQQSNCLKWQMGCKECLQRNNLVDKCSRNQYLKVKYINAIRDRLTIVSVSEWLNGLVTQSLLNPIRQKVIYNGVDLNILFPKDISDIINFNGKKVILGVANIWTQSKGLDAFIRLREQLDDKYIIVLVGIDNKYIESLPDGIVGISRTQNLEELANLYSRADVHLSMSIQETFGMTLAESFACGTPSIAYDTTALPEVISKDTGIVVPVGDLNGVCNAIEEICSNNKKYTVTNCRNRAEHYFNQKIQFGKYINLYENILRQSKN